MDVVGPRSRKREAGSQIPRRLEPPCLVGSGASENCTNWQDVELIIVVVIIIIIIIVFLSTSEA